MVSNFLIVMVIAGSYILENPYISDLNIIISIIIYCLCILVLCVYNNHLSIIYKNVEKDVPIIVK